MGMSRCYSLMKCLLILLNIIFLCVGSGACAFAAWALWDGSGGEGAGESASGRAGLCALAAWGCALGVGALAALCGAARDSASLLAGAFALLALSAVAEGAAAWWGAAHLPQLRRALRDRLDHTVRHDYGVSASRTQVMDALQQGLQCCGSEGVRDWQNSAWSVSQGSGAGVGVEGEGVRAGARVLDLSVGAEPAYYWVPESCCAEGVGSTCETARRVAAASGAAAGLHGAGCGERALAALGRSARGPLAAAAALLAAHGAALLLTLALCLRARPEQRYKA